MQTSIELEFGDGTYSFALKLPQIVELQRLRSAGIFAIYGRVLKGRYFVRESGAPFGVPHEAEAFAEDLYETIRLGLIGGGSGMVNGESVMVDVNRAKQLVETYAHPQPLKEVWTIAAAVLAAKIEGYEPPLADPAEAPAPEKPKRRTGSKPRK